jgi:SecD/SecF fusion protein
VPVYNLGVVKYTYVDCKEREIQLGLDLKGGMNVILEVSVEDMLRALSNYSTDSTFNRAIRQAKERQKVSQADFITLFAEEFQKIDPNGSLAAIFSTVELKDKINFRSSNADVIKVLRSETQAAIDNAFNIISNRIDQFGVVNPKIQRLETQGRILVELPGVSEPERVRKILQSTANLEFWLTYENSEILPSLIQANSRLRDILKAERAASDSLKQTAKKPAQTREEKKTEISLLEKLEKDTTAADTGISGLESWNQQNPLFAVLRPNIDRNNAPLPGSMVGLVHVKDTGKLNYYLSLKPVKAILPRDVRFLYSAKPWQNDPSGTLFEVHAIKVTTRDGRAPLSGDVVTSARREFGQTKSSAEVAMSMNPEGAKIWARMTSDNVGRCIAIVLDDKVQSSPRVNGPITGGHSQITGNFTIKEADDLANILKSGKLPAKAQIIQETVVGPSLGKEAIQAGIKSFIIAFLAVVLYMIFFYTAQAGLYADFALIFNVFFIMGILASLGAVLTLPGIAGIVLTLGTAVDANVLIYERIKEEIAAGKGPKLAVADGYKMAMSAIIDSNVTTLLSGVVLYVFGTGPIRGFATTLIIGILTSLFTAIFLVRLLYEWRLNRGMDVRFTNRFSKGFLKNVKVKLLEKRKII